MVEAAVDDPHPMVGVVAAVVDVSVSYNLTLLLILIHFYFHSPKVSGFVQNFLKRKWTKNAVKSLMETINLHKTSKLLKVLSDIILNKFRELEIESKSSKYI